MPGYFGSSCSLHAFILNLQIWFHCNLGKVFFFVQFEHNVHLLPFRLMNSNLILMDHPLLGSHSTPLPHPADNGPEEPI